MSLWNLLPVAKALLTVGAFLSWAGARERFGPGTMLLGAQLGVASLVECYGSYLSLNAQHNLWLYNAYIPIEFTLLSTYAIMRAPFPWLRPIMVFAVIIFALFNIPEQAEAWHQTLFVSRSFQFGAAIVAGAFTVLLIDRAMSSEDPLSKHPLNYLLFGAVVFFGGAIPILGLINVLNETNTQLAARLFLINDGLFFVRYGLIIIGILLTRRTVFPSP